MSNTVPISAPSNFPAPTPQNTPLTNSAPIAGLSRPTVPDISEDPENADDQDDDDDDGKIAPGVGGAMQSAILGMVESRLSTLVGKSSGYIESLPVEVKRSVEALKGVQVKQTDLQNQYKRECWELEQKYHALQQPLYSRRHQIITGAEKPTADEVAAGEAQSAKDDSDYTPLPKDKDDATGISEFWLTALRNHPGISDLITDRDAEALKHLTDIQLSYLPKEDPKPGFKLTFIFTPNEYFTNETLEKTYIYQAEVGYSGDFMYERAIGSEIKWKDEKDLTKEFEIKKQRNKNTNRTRLVRKAHPAKSFFNFFNPPEPPSEEALEGGDIDEEELADLEERCEVDYQIGEDIKERIIPRAIDYFTGKALEYEDLEDNDDDYEDLDDDDEDPFEDDDESDEDEEVPARRHGPPKRGAGAGAQAVNAEECKNQ